MDGTSKLANIQNPDGSNEQYTILNSFELEDISRKFVIYHKNEIANGVQKIYISEVDDKEPGLLVFKTIDDESWNRVKEMLKVIANSSGEMTNTYLVGYDISDTSKLVKQGGKEIGVSDASKLCKPLPAPTKEVEEKQTESVAPAPFVENPFSAPAPASVATAVVSTPVVEQNTMSAPAVQEPITETVPRVEPLSTLAPETPTIETTPQEESTEVVENKETVAPAVQDPAEPSQPELVTPTPVVNNEPILENPAAPSIPSVETTELPKEKEEVSDDLDASAVVTSIMENYENKISALLAKMKTELLTAINNKLNESKEIEANSLNELNNYAANAVNEVKQVEAPVANLGVPTPAVENSTLAAPTIAPAPTVEPMPMPTPVQSLVR